MRVLLVDNYDSYTYNLHQQLARIGGREPVVIRNDELEVGGGALATFVEAHAIEAVVISPGPGRPERVRDFGVCRELIETCALPLLGVCLGHQGIAWCAGATIDRAPEPIHGRLSPVFHDGEGLLAGLPQGFEVVRYHSLAVVGMLPQALRRTAWTESGVLMGLRHVQRPQWGVQFHPESVATQFGDRIIENFLDLAQRWRRSGKAARGARPGRPRASARAGEPASVDVEIRALDRWVEPEDAFVARYAGARRCFWLDSASGEGGHAGYSFMGAVELPADRTIRYDRGRRELQLETGESCERVRTGLLDWLDADLGPRATAPSHDLPFAGGLVGYLGYELRAESHDAPGEVPAAPQPDALLLDCQRLLAFDHARRRVLLISREADALARARWFDATARALATAGAAPPVAASGSATGSFEFHLARGRRRYLADVAACLDAIASGESYEVCLTNQLVGPPISRPLDAYRTLRARNPAPMAAFLRVDELAVLSCSPELFLRVDRRGEVVTRPIKGTAARDENSPENDAAARDKLAISVKDRAENLMIVDLMRNDLGRVCEVGSVEVPGLMQIETFASVHQMVSTIRGRLRPRCGVVDLLRATFPGGSMTGAPKLRTMEILDALERAPRGIYSGCIGYLGDARSGGAAQLSIVIRTAVCTPDQTQVGVGGAVVAQSDPQAEFAEILLKAEAVLRGLAEAEGLELQVRVD